MRPLILAALALLAAPSALAQPTADSSFADNGFALVKVESSVGSAATDAVVLPDGTTLALGYAFRDNENTDPFVARLDPDGTPSASFGTRGVVRLDTAAFGQLYLNSVAATGDGRIALAGNVLLDPATGARGAVVVVLLADGRPDPAFGTGGVLRPYGTRLSESTRIAADGTTLYLAGRLFETGNNASRAALTRIMPAGVDSAYAVDGSYVAGPGTAFNDIGVDPNGKTFLVGTTAVAGADTGSALFLALTPGGDIDPEFGLSSRRIGFLSTSARHLLRRADGGLVVAGTTTLNLDGFFDTATVLWSVRSDGTLDPDFGTDGYAVYNVRDRDAGLGGHEIPGRPGSLDGGVLGVVVEGGGTDGFRVLVVHPDGSPELTNGPDGVATVFADRAGLSNTASVFVDQNTVVVVGGQGAPEDAPAGTPFEAFVARAFVKYRPTAGEAVPESRLALAVAPNPVAHTARVTLTLDAPTHASVRVLDALGRAVATLADGPLAAGGHTLSLDAARLPAGVYAVVATVGGERSVTRVTVVR